MDKSLLLLAAQACAASYVLNTDLGTTEYSLSKITYNNNPLQILAMPGTNEMADWLWNIHLWSKRGVKRCTYFAVEDIHKAIKNKLDPDIPLLVAGHSKAGPDALQYMAKHKADYCVSFCPAPAFRRWNRPTLKNTTIVIDPDDLVPWAGIVNFTHPRVSDIVRLPRDKHWFDLKSRIKDHMMRHVIDFLKT